MKVLLVNGSSHRNGTTMQAIKEMVSVFEAEGVETEVNQLGGKPLADCLQCNKCRDTGRCVFEYYGINDFDWHYRVVDLHAAISAWESGNGWDFMTEEIYTDMVAALNAAHDFFGPELDPQSGYAAEE